MSKDTTPTTDTESQRTDGDTEMKVKDAWTEMSSTNTTTTTTSSTDGPVLKMPWIERSSMENRQLHSSQKEALKKIPEFSGEEHELDIDEWLFDLTNLFKLMKLNDETKILETMGKLTGPALRWYQQQLHTFNNWNETEEVLKERFKEPTSDSQLMKEFFELHQEEHQSVSSFYEMVMRKHRKASKFITERQLITVLQNGVKNSLKEHLIRKEKEINSPDKWLELAREEDHVQKRLQQRSEEAKHEKFNTMLPMATINLQPSKSNDEQKQYQRNGQSSNNRSKYQQQKNNQPTKKCLLCNRTNHWTSQCFHKQETGCFRCGQEDHRIRYCPHTSFFE